MRPLTPQARNEFPQNEKENPVELRDTHINDYYCNFCSKAFDRKFSFNRHMKVLHNESPKVSHLNSNSEGLKVPHTSEINTNLLQNAKVIVTSSEVETFEKNCIEEPIKHVEKSVWCQQPGSHQFSSRSSSFNKLRNVGQNWAWFGKKSI